MKRRRPFWLLTHFLEIATLALVIATLWLSWETRQGVNRQIAVQTWLEMVKRYDSPEMKTAMAKLATQLDPYDQTKTNLVDETVLTFFDDVGALYAKGMIDKELTVSAFSYDGNRWWFASQKYIQDERKADGNDPTLFHEFETFAKAMQSNDPKLTAEDVKKFLRDVEKEQ